ncbi:MAG: GAF domain-containing protein [Anaerolineae bacterium]
MEQFADYVLLLLAQFAGGPGPRENNLIRFGLPAILWAVLLAVAWSRQRQQELPREKMLVWGFGLGLARELYMFGHVSLGFITGGEPGAAMWHLAEPLEHGLTMAAVVMVGGAFIRYILDDMRITRRYLQAGLTVAGIAFIVTWTWWYQIATANPEARFNRTPAGLISHLLVAVFAASAMVLLWRRKGWLRNVVTIAMGFFVVSGMLRLVNFTTSHNYDYIICPICNSLHILAIPILGYVYIREQSIEKQRAEDSLQAYRDHLEDLVEERTTELTNANEQLQIEVAEREQAEAKIAQRNVELAAQNAIAATISRSLELDTVLNTAMDTVLAVLEMDAGCLYLLDPDGETLIPQTRRGSSIAANLPEPAGFACSCAGISRKAVEQMKPVALDTHEFSCDEQSPFVSEQDLATLVSTPLVSKGRALGALSLGTKHGGAVRSEDLDLLTAIGHQIGMAVENAHLYRETDYWAKELAMLHQVSVFLSSTLEPEEVHDHITEQSAKLLGCQASILFRWDGERHRAFGASTYGMDGTSASELSWALEDCPLLEEMLADRKSTPVIDALQDPRVPLSWQEQMQVRGLLCVPVWGAEEPLALLFMIERSGPRSWRPADIELVESFVNRAAIALENAYLHKRLEWAAALEERQRIAAEMHDGLAQTLSYLTLRSHQATELIEEGHTREALTEHVNIRDALAQASVEVRRSIASLQESPPPRRPFQEWLTEIVREAEETGDSRVQLVLPTEEPLFLPPDHLEQVVKVLQEALVNVNNHAQAHQVSVRLERADGEVLLSVEDDGRGFDPGVIPHDGREHFGLSIMRARAARIGGEIEIQSAPGEGTCLTLRWPLHKTSLGDTRPLQPRPQPQTAPI